MTSSGMVVRNRVDLERVDLGHDNDSRYWRSAFGVSYTRRLRYRPSDGTPSARGTTDLTAPDHRLPGRRAQDSTSPGPFAGSGVTFSLSALPPGDYEIEAWHPTPGTVSEQVSVTATGTPPLTLEFTAAG